MNRYEPDYETELWGEDLVPDYPDYFEPECTPLEIVRCWLKKQRFLPQELTNEFLQRFLIANCFNIRKTTKRIKKYFYLRQEPWEVFRDRNPQSPLNRKLFGHLYAIPLKNLNSKGDIILLTGMAQPSTKYSLGAHLKLVVTTLDYLFWDQKNLFSQVKILMDGSNFQCPALLENPFRHWKPYVRDFLDSMPALFGGFYILRPPAYAKDIFELHDGITLVKFDRLRDVTAVFPENILPCEFGGCLGPLQELLDCWNSQMQRSERFFLDFEERMEMDYEKRLCFERDLREGGKNWVQWRRLVEEESSYKKNYYEKMANLKPLVHPGFGGLRRKKPIARPKPATRLLCRDDLVEDSDEPETKLRQQPAGAKCARRPSTLPPAVQLIFCIEEPPCFPS